MLRKIFLSVTAVLAMAATSQAAIMLQQSLSAVQPTIPSAAGPLVAYDLRAVSDSGQTINTVENPSIIANLLGLGLHQTWAPFSPAGTPTRAEQAPPLWNDAWLPYDSYFLFSPANSLSVGGAFTETNNAALGVPPASLPAGAGGAPITGFGTYGSAAGASKLFTIDSGFPDSDVTFAQLVMRATDSVLVSMGVRDDTGALTEFDDVCIGFGCGVVETFEVDDFMDHGYLPGALITGGPLTTNDSDDPNSVAWALVSLIGPDGAEVGATVDPLTGVFSWQSSALDSRGLYEATISGTNVGGTPVGADTGVFSFNLVPEPASITLLGLAMVGFGFIRRR